MRDPKLKELWASKAATFAMWRDQEVVSSFGELSEELEAAKQGVAILFCSHILDDVDRLCQGFGIIVNGETVVSGARDDLLETSGPQANFEIRLSDARAFKPTAAQGITILGQQPNKVFVSLASGQKPQKIWANLLAANWPIEEIVKYGSSLEDFYLAQVANAQGLELAA